MEQAQKMEQLERRIEAIETDLRKLVDTVTGSGDDLSPGIVGMLRRHTKRHDSTEARVGKVETTISRIIWIVTGSAFGGAGIGGAIVSLITQGQTGS